MKAPETFTVLIGVLTLAAGNIVLVAGTLREMRAERHQVRAVIIDIAKRLSVMEAQIQIGNDRLAGIGHRLDRIERRLEAVEHR